MIGRAGCEFEQVRALPDGKVTVRQACPQDADIIQAYIRALSPASRHHRFLGAVNELPATELHRMTHKGPGRYPALIAETVVGGIRRMVGEARYAVTPNGLTCEFAVSVADAWRHKNIGTFLIGNVASRAKALGARCLVGDVLRSNGAMTALARKLGFSVTETMTYPGSIKVTKDLSRPDAAAAALAYSCTLSRAVVKTSELRLGASRTAIVVL